jgi:hypothetical protein
MVAKLIEDNKEICYIYFDDTILPIKCKQKRLFLKENINLDKLINEKSICCTIWNAGIPDKIKEFSKEELLLSNMLISDLYRKGLK